MGNSTASGLKRMYRMPISFGPSAGPRNVPSDAPYQAGTLRTASVSVTARSDANALTALLPDGCKLDGEPMLTARITHMYDIGWLAGRSYNILMITVPVQFHNQGELLRGNFMPVLWESLADPILTGRDELGHPKLWAEIPDPVVTAHDQSGTRGLGDRIVAWLPVLRGRGAGPAGRSAACPQRSSVRSHREVRATYRVVGRGRRRLSDLRGDAAAE